jgi:hypothetical protein
MAQRPSGYVRNARDEYYTPAWTWHALHKVEPWSRQAWDCAPQGATFDFLESTMTAKYIATNPPFSLATEFVVHALKLTEPHQGRVAFLLRSEWDTAKGRSHLFANNRTFARKLVITKRIRWTNLKQQKAGPSSNHAWYCWNWQHDGPPTIGWI